MQMHPPKRVQTELQKHPAIFAMMRRCSFRSISNHAKVYHIMKKYPALFCILFLVPLFLTAQEQSERSVIIDTDGSPDDLRAINLMLASPNTEILAITSADGVLEPEEGLMKIRALLNSLGHQGIITSQGIITRNEPTPERALAREISWGEEPISYRKPTEIKELLVKTIEQEPAGVDIISLGPLTNIANAILIKPSIKEKIRRIIWFDRCQTNQPCSNYGLDSSSADYMLSTEIPLYRIFRGDENIKLSSSYIDSLGKMASPYAQSIYRSHQHDSIQKRLSEERLIVWNELASMFFHHPGLFEKDTTYKKGMGRVMRPTSPDSLLASYSEQLQLLNNLPGPLFKRFPTDRNLYRDDLAARAKEIQKLHGTREWRAAVLTGEVYGQLKLAALAGVKMGTRMLEYFHATPGELEIILHCEETPRLKALAEGVAVASQATTTNGKLQIRKEVLEPHAQVTYQGRQIEIFFHKEPLQTLRKETAKISDSYTPGTASYQQALHQKVIHYWKEWDRKEIFRIAESTP